ncbi:MAG: prolipoprotein diacylglyceryl transferase [Flavobacteriaceae bacterium]|nr:prolipoprotein diacylglyceryl transferase [Flavobacteriaceae bacterium]|tara:strand:- start:12021 stop:12878 length:858 start_codon:yes stop_codon:yes gene_type:complete
MNIFLSLQINWSPNETLFEIGSFGLHYYSLMFVLAFTIGYKIVEKYFIAEGVSKDYLEPLFVFMVFSTLIGARLGEVFFYSWDYYQNHLLEILLPIRENSNKFLFGFIKGYEFTGFRGLASHGAAIGIISGIIIFQLKYKLKSTLWVFDRLTVPVSLGGVFIRLGNFINSEILGIYTGSNYGVVFQNRGDILPRHPAQLYESLGYLILFLILRKVYPKVNHISGYLLGIFLSGIFSIRFLVEYVKESQGGFEENLPFLSTGQWLSIPLIVSGLLIILWAKSRKTS